METNKIENSNREKILITLLKEPLKKHTITSIASDLKISRPGTWKILKKLQDEELIKLSSIGNGKTNTYIVNLNWQNSLTEKTLELILTKEALKHKQWRFDFEKLEKRVDFLILHGSILHMPKQANDIDILGIVSNKKRFAEINKILLEIQKTQLKEIHLINLTPSELKAEIQSQNNAFIDAIKKGVVLFGQDEFIKSVKELK